MTPQEFTELMAELEKEYEYYISIGDQISVDILIGQMNSLEADYGRGG